MLRYRLEIAGFFVVWLIAITPGQGSALRDRGAQKLGDVVTIDNLIPDGHNANAGTKRGLDLLDQSLRRNGAGRSILIDKHNRVIAGNKTLERAADIGLDDVIVVDSDGSKLVAVRRVDLDLETDPQARALAYFDNRTSEVSLAWSPEQIAADLEAGLDLGQMFYPDELSAILEQAADDMLGGEAEQEPDLTRADVPDAVFATDNEYGIPTLNLALQATMLEAPVLLWGALARRTQTTGTYAFYVDDWRFNALWTDPSPVVNSGCHAVIEPNITISPIMPKAVALYRMYQKRWVTRFWQEFGIKTLVDLNVPEPWLSEIALLGVPKGWRSYATHGNANDCPSTLAEYETARKHADGADVLFVVYGGGKAAKAQCLERGWVYVPEHMDTKRGGVVANGG